MNYYLIFLACATLVLADQSRPTPNAIKKYIYFTSDGGPNAGTPYVLTAATHSDVPMTFFINSDNFDTWSGKANFLNKNSVMRMVTEGHVIGDLSTNHMVHNSESGQSDAFNTYQNISDVRFFGSSNLVPVGDVLDKSKATRAQLRSALTSMAKLVRLPHTDHWRVKMVNGEVIKYNCLACTLPKSSNDIAIQIADDLFSRGRFVFGWDVEWKSNWGRGLSEPVDNFMEKVTKFQNGLLATKGGPNKLVVLTHDHGFINNHDAAEEYKEFFKRAKAAGFEFRTLDTYHTD